MTGLDALTRKRLAGRPLYRGQRVPVIVAWNCRGFTSEHPEWGWIQDCEHVDGRGKPDFGQLCMREQVRVVENRLCQVCGQEFGPGELMWLVGTFSAWFKEPAFHAGCGLYAMRMCPELRRRRSECARSTSVTGCTSYIEAATLRFQDELLGTDQVRALASPENPVIWLYAGPVEPTVQLPLGEWL